MGLLSRRALEKSSCPNLRWHHHFAADKKQNAAELEESAPAYLARLFSARTNRFARSRHNNGLDILTCHGFLEGSQICPLDLRPVCEVLVRLPLQLFEFLNT